MSYANFIPTVWEEAIQTELERQTVFEENCNRQFEGKVKEAGDSVRILGVGAPTISETVIGRTGATDITLSDPEDVADTSVTMKIDHVAHFNFKVGDIDEAQAVGNVMGTLRNETTLGLANKQDIAIAKLANDPIAVKSTSTQATSATILSLIDTAIQELWENDVPQNAKITATVPPWVYMMIKQNYTAIDTNNSAMLKNGLVAMYGNVGIKLSNNVYNDGTDDYIQIKTDKALAFARPLVHTEAYRPEKKFADALKGFVLYGCKVVRPKEMYVLKLHA